MNEIDTEIIYGIILLLKVITFKPWYERKIWMLYPTVFRRLSNNLHYFHFEKKYS